MWNYIIDMLSDAVVAAFSWFAQILNAAPGSWDTYLYIFLVLIAIRFLLYPLLGAAFSLGSDKAKKNAGGKNG